MKKTIIKRFKITGLYRYLDYDIPFHEGINIMHGINGKGKTTILNILTNLLNGDLNRFYRLSFQKIEIEFNEDDYVKLYRDIESKSGLILLDYKFENQIFEKRDIKNANSVKALLRRIKLSPLLLPAQRVSLEDTYSIDDEYYHRTRYMRAQYYGGKEHDHFQPDSKMINVANIPNELVERVRKFSFQVTHHYTRLDNSLFESFFESIFLNRDRRNKPSNSSILHEIAEIKDLKEKNFQEYKHTFKGSRVLEKIELQLDRITEHNDDIEVFLKLYRQNIERKSTIINRYITPFVNLENIINSLFEGKKINVSIDSSLKDIFKMKSEAGDSLGIHHLSSGEKNLLLIFFHFLFEMKPDTFFMIDEPELSLHIDWQEHIIRYFNQYSSGNQILVVTHSPDILQGYRNYEINLDKCRILNHE